MWRRLAGLFGAEALERKFGAEPPPEWAAMILRLRSHEITRGIRRLAYSGLGRVPTLPEFVKFCRAVGDDGFDLPPQPQPLIEGPKWTGDKWDEAANLHLFDYIRRRIASGAVYADPDSKAGRRKACEPSQETRDLVAPLLSAKRAWAHAMRDTAVDKSTGEDLGVEPKIQLDVWTSLMAEAERIVETVRQRYAMQRAGRAA